MRVTGDDVERAGAFENERPRLLRLAAHLLDDPHEAEDMVQQAWLRLSQSPSEVVDPPAWLTTVTTRLCLDRLKARVPAPAETLDREPRIERGGTLHDDPARAAEHADTVGQALHVVVQTMSPNERVAFVLADSFGVDFATIGAILDRSAASARQLASRARTRVAEGRPPGPVSDRQIVDAFLAAARGGDLPRLLHLLAPDVQVSADAAALLAGTPASLRGREAVAQFFDGAARAALSVSIDGRAGAAWFHRGAARVAFDFTVADGRVQAIVFRAAPDVLATIAR